MKKKFIITAATVFTLAGCSASSVQAATLVEKVSTPTTQVAGQALWKGTVLPQTLLAKQAAYQAKLNSNAQRLKTVVKKVKKRVGKTWYVFSGATPAGWDCSGLVMWMYGQLGVQLEHSAGIQKNSGVRVKEPKVGDIVAFSWGKYPGAFHVGIYIGNGNMVHSGGKRGEATEIVNIKKWAKGNGSSVRITYTRILETV